MDKVLSDSGISYMFLTLSRPFIDFATKYNGLYSERLNNFKNDWKFKRKKKQEKAKIVMQVL